MTVIDTEVWHVVEFSPKGADDWAVADSRTADSIEGARRLLESHRKFRRSDRIYDFRIVRKTLQSEVVA